MNGKKATLIRGIAESHTVNRDKVSYMVQAKPKIPNYRNIKLRPECTRAVYKQMKKTYLRSIRA